MARQRKRARERKAQATEPEAETEADVAVEDVPDAEPEPERGGGEDFGPPLSAEQIELLYLFLHWVVRYGEPPEPEDWAATPDWPRPVEVDRAFPDYGWDDLWHFTDLDHAELFVRQDALAEERKTAKAAEQQAASLRRRIERETAKLPELRRLADAARERRDAATKEAKDLRRDAETLRGERDAMRERAETAEAALRDARETPAAAAASPDAQLEEALEAERTAGERARSERDVLHEELGRLGDAHERLREHVARLERMLEERAAAAVAEGAGEDDEGSDGADEPEPKTVLEAVERASGRARHLRYAPAAFSSAGQSPFTRPGMILETLDRLDALAGAYAEPGGMGRSLSQAAREFGLLGWRGGVSETARTRNATDYTVSFEGQAFPMGPHVALGTGSGSGAVARIYLAAADGTGDVERGLIVAHVGRHLPDSTTA